jgi:tetratricopeptide (TPR) repeat protein
MVGRDRELQALLGAFEDVISKGRTRLVSVIGAPGLGKSRLVKEFLWAVEGRATVLSGRCLPYGEGITFWPLLEAVREAAGILDDDAPEAARAKVAAAVSEAGDAERVGEKLTGLLGFGQRVATLEEGFWAARRFLETLAWRRPVVAVFDDVHWAEPGFLDLVAYLHRLGEDAPLLIVAPGRPEMLESRPDWGGEILPLAPLSADESAELLSSLVGGGELPETATRRIAQAAEGNPLFVGEMFRKLIDDDLLRHDAGRWVAAGNLETVTVPPTVNALLAARLDRLGPDDRGVIERASVLGKEFDERTLWALTPPADRAGVGARLDALSRRDLVQAETGPMAEPGTYRFSHILIRDAAYQGMLKQDRADLHERYATWLATRAGDRPQEEIVGYHLEQAHRYRADLGGAEEEVRDLAGMAAAALSAAGHRAWARGDIPATVNLLERAAALEPDERRRLALVPDLGDALAEAGEFARAAALLSESVERSRALGDAAGEWHARIAQVKTLVLTDPHGMADQERRVADEAIEVFTRTGDELGLARAWHLRARADNLWGRMEDRKDALAQALGHARIAGAVRDQTQILTEIVSAVFYGPTPAEEGIAWCGRILEESSGNPRIEARVLNAEAGFLAMQGRFEEAHDRVRRSAALFEELGMTVMGAVTAQDRSLVFMLAGDAEGAEAELRRGYDVLERIGEASYQCSLACMIGQSLVAQGRMVEAEAYARTGAGLAAHDDYDAQIMWRSVLSRVHASRGEHAEAEALAREAVRLAFETDFFQSRADSLSDLAEVLASAGRPDEARAEAERAIEILDAKGNVVTAAALRERWGASTSAAPAEA